MADENGDVKGVKLADSNMANYGSKAHIDARKAAAETEKEFKGAGQKVGLEIWRVENRRTENDTPDFGVKRWPQEDYGNFYTGDSYIVLNTYLQKDPLTGKPTDKLAWDVHFWLGAETTQDEMGVAAYKTVELDDLLDDGPVQHRETQGHESKLFQSYFKAICYMEGGIASGFRQVKPEEYKPRMFHVQRNKHGNVRCLPVEPKASNLYKDDVFVLDLGLKVYMYVGPKANAFEKLKGGAVAHNIVSSRNGKAKKYDEPDEDFWKCVGSPDDVKETDPKGEEDPDNADPAHCKLFRLSDSTGSMKITKVCDSNPTKAMLDSSDVFIVDAVGAIFVWIGNGATKAEKSQSMKYADAYLKESGRPSYTPVTAVQEGQIEFAFDFCFAKS